jgi:hypothetical protein
MRNAVSDANVTEINVLRDISVELLPEQIINTTVNGWNISSPKNNGNNVDGKDVATGAYTRRSGSLKVNGNYFTVESSKVPLVDARSGESEVMVKPDGSAYALVDTRFALFLLGTRATASADVYQIDNLNIKGNGDMDSKKAYDWDGRSVLQNSGAAICVEVGSGTLNMNNVTSRFGSFAVLLSSNVPQTINGVETHAITFNAVDCKFEKNWANNIYANGSINLTLDSCYIGVANGAAVHYDVSPSSIAVDAELNMINDTVIENWVTGEEAWFVAQGAGGAVGAIKAEVEPKIKQFSQDTKSIVKVIDGVEKVNFAVLMRRKGENGEWLGGKDGLGSKWLANTDAHYRGYIQQNYKGQGSVAFNQPTLDLAYLTFMNGAGYPATSLEQYVGNALMNNKYVYFPSELLGYMEFLVEMVNA